MMKRNRQLKQITAKLLLFTMLLLQPLSAPHVQAASPAAGSSQIFQSFDAGWNLAATGCWTYLKNGTPLRSAWICDQTSGSHWYVLDENGFMAEGPLVLDQSSGKYYLLNNTVHDGTFGAMITADGLYYGRQLVFHKDHDGSFGALEDEAQIRALAELLGVREVEPKSVEYVGKARISSSSDDDNNTVPDTHIYSITYDFAGGDDFYENPKGYTKVSEKITLKAPEREGYTFLGWTEGSAEGQTPVKSPVIPRGSTGDKNFTAHWEQQICTVTIKSNDPDRGSTDTTDVKVPYGTKIRAEGSDLYIGDTKITAKATPSTPEKTYSFHDWSTPLTIKQDTNVYANFTDGTDLCTVTIKSGLKDRSEYTGSFVKNSYCYPSNYFDTDGYLIISWHDQDKKLFIPGVDRIGNGTVLTATVTEDLFEEFQKLEHVVKVKRCQKINQFYLYFEQPLDWNDPGLGSFVQKVQVILNGTKRINVLNTEGYLDNLLTSSVIEALSIFDGNFVSPEHRFYGCSVPAGFCPDAPAYWQYLTTANAAADTHRIRTELASVLTGKWVATGVSKGGLTTNLQAFYYPNDFEIYMPYVAPLCNGIGDERFMKFVNESIGDDYYGKETAAQMRQWVLDIMCWCEENRDTLTPAVWNKMVNENGFRLADGITPEIYLELCLLDFQVSCWQYKLLKDPDFSKIKALKVQLEDPAVSIETKTAKILKDVIAEGGYECNDRTYPYYVQSLSELGQYYWTTAYLQEALEKRGSSIRTAIPADADAAYYRDLILTDALKQIIRYDSSTYDKMIDWIGSTDQKIMMIFGSCDPWTAVRIPTDSSKENIKVYILPGLCHYAFLNKADPKTQKEAKDILYNWLDIQETDLQVN